MTSYTAIANGDIDQDSPVTQPLVTALRDNPIAIGEADSSVPAGLLPTVLLGTINTTSGTTQTLTSLDLNPYKFVCAVFNGVSTSAAGGTSTFTIRLAGSVVVSKALSLGGSINAVRGVAHINLFSGVGTSCVEELSAAEPSSIITTNSQVLRTSLRNASTSISLTLTATSGAPTFGAGEVRIYGVK
jgi:hypothetical protein